MFVKAAMPDTRTGEELLGAIIDGKLFVVAPLSMYATFIANIWR